MDNSITWWNILEEGSPEKGAIMHQRVSDANKRVSAIKEKYLSDGMGSLGDINFLDIRFKNIKISENKGESFTGEISLAGSDMSFDMESITDEEERNNIFKTLLARRVQLFKGSFLRGSKYLDLIQDEKIQREIVSVYEEIRDVSIEASKDRAEGISEHDTFDGYLSLKLSQEKKRDGKSPQTEQDISLATYSPLPENAGNRLVIMQLLKEVIRPDWPVAPEEGKNGILSKMPTFNEMEEVVEKRFFTDPILKNMVTEKNIRQTVERFSYKKVDSSSIGKILSFLNQSSNTPSTAVKNNTKENVAIEREKFRSIFKNSILPTDDLPENKPTESSIAADRYNFSEQLINFLEENKPVFRGSHIEVIEVTEENIDQVKEITTASISSFNKGTSEATISEDIKEINVGDYVETFSGPDHARPFMVKSNATKEMIGLLTGKDVFVSDLKFTSEEGKEIANLSGFDSGIADLINKDIVRAKNKLEKLYSLDAGKVFNQIQNNPNFQAEAKRVYKELLPMCNSQIRLFPSQMRNIIHEAANRFESEGVLSEKEIIYAHMLSVAMKSGDLKGVLEEAMTGTILMDAVADAYTEEVSKDFYAKSNVKNILAESLFPMRLTDTYKSYTPDEIKEIENIISSLIPGENDIPPGLDQEMDNSGPTNTNKL